MSDQDPAEPDDVAGFVDGDDSIHAPGDGTEDPPEPGAGLGEEVEESDEEDEVPQQ
jgi:hypothetical protein